MPYTTPSNTDTIISRKKINCGCQGEPGCPCNDGDDQDVNILREGININLNVGSNNNPSSDYNSPYIYLPSFPMVQFDPGVVYPDVVVPDLVAPDGYVPNSEPMPGTNDVPDVAPVPLPERKVIELERTKTNRINTLLPAFKYTVNKKTCVEEFFPEFP